MNVMDFLYALLEEVEGLLVESPPDPSVCTLCIQTSRSCKAKALETKVMALVDDITDIFPLKILRTIANTQAESLI